MPKFKMGQSNGKVITFGGKAIQYTPPGPIVLGFPMYLGTTATESVDIELGGTGPIQLDNGNGTIIDDSLSIKSFNLTNIGTEVTILGDNIDYLNVSGNTSINTLVVSGNTNLVTLNLSDLSFGVFNIDFTNNTNLESLDFSDVTYGQPLILNNNINLTSLDVSGLNGACNEINVSNTQLTSLLVPSSNIQYLDVSNTLITSLDGVLSGVVGTINISDTTISSFGSITLNNVIEILANSCDITSLSSVGGSPGGLVEVKNCLSLASLNLSNRLYIEFDESKFSGSTNLISVTLQAMGLFQSVVDGILVELDSYGKSNGTLDISGGTGDPALGGTANQKPSATGLAAKSSLEGKGWTVTVNTEFPV
jgi:hypothetical protein